MSEPAPTYTSIDERSRSFVQSWRVWAITLAVVLLWISAIAAAPIFRSAGIEYVSAPLYEFFSYICHQIPDRSLHIAGHQMGVCSRCFGVYFGLLAGVAVYPLWRPVDEIQPIPRVWLFLSVIPMAIDWSLTIFGIWENTHITRFVTGVILGAACSTFIIPALVELTRNLTYRRSHQKSRLPAA